MVTGVVFNTFGGVGVDAAIGTEIDVTVSYQLTDDLVVTGGLGYVASGDAIDETAPVGTDDALVSIVFTATLDF